MNCGHCAKSFHSGRLLRKHEKICFASYGKGAFFSDTTFYCILCDDLFYVRLAFAWHLRSHLKSNISISQKEDIKATLCCIGSSRLQKTDRSLERLKSQKVALREGNSCEIEFANAEVANLYHKLCDSTEQSSLNHMVSVFECDACNRSFDNLDLLENHSCVSPSSPEIGKQETVLPDEFSPVQVVIPKDKKSDGIGQLSYERSDVYSRYLCLFCNMMVLTPRMAHYHLLRHKPDHHVPFATNVCPICRRELDNREELALHLHSLHSNPKESDKMKRNTDVICEICGSVLKSYAFYENHMLRVHNFMEEKSVLYSYCKECNQRFRDKRGLQLHLKYKKCQFSRKADSCVVASPMLCIYCGCGFPNGLTLGKHVKRKHRSFMKGKKYMCCETDCKKLFSGYGNLARHHRSAHSPPKNECSVCHKVLDKTRDYFLHLLKHKLPKFHCPLCHKLINGPASCLRVHLNNFHFPGLRYYRKAVAKAVKRTLLRSRKSRRQPDELNPEAHCSRCSQIFENEERLLRHSFKQHSGDIPTVTMTNGSNVLPMNISFLSPKSVDIVESTLSNSTSSLDIERHNLTDNRSNCMTSEPSPLDSLSLFCTLKFGGVDLPVYQLTPGQFEQLQLDGTASLMGTSFTTSQ